MITMQTITAVIPAKNEELNIRRCLESLQWCNKIIVISTGTDKTATIAKSMGATVVTGRTANQDSFEDVQRNLNTAIKQCTTDWMLRIDADEVVTEELQTEIQALLNSKFHNDVVAFGIPRQQYFLGKFLRGGDWAYDRLVRLFKPEFCSYNPIVRVHEQFKVNGEIAYLKSTLLHYSHPNFRTLMKKFDSYTTLEAKALHETKLSAFVKLLILPPYIFLRWVFYHHGYRDGMHGVFAGFMRSFYDAQLYFKFLFLKNQ